LPTQAFDETEGRGMVLVGDQVPTTVPPLFDGTGVGGFRARHVNRDELS
jgi:hypothetical protein